MDEDVCHIYRAASHGKQRERRAMSQRTSMSSVGELREVDDPLALDGVVQGKPRKFCHARRVYIPSSRR